MLLADLELLGDLAGSLEVALMGPHAADASTRYGTGALPAFGFAALPDEAARFSLLNRVTSQPHPLCTAIANTDLVVLAGGGNLSSASPEMLFERAAVARVAAAAGVAVLILGQTIGPRLDPAHEPILGELLRGAALVGVRDRTSEAWARRLGVESARLLFQADDALRLEPRPPTLPAGFDPHRPYLAVTLHPFAVLDDPRVRLVAGQLAHWCERQGLQLLYVPENLTADGPGGINDADMAAALVAVAGGFALAPPHAPAPDARGVAWAAAHAQMVLSSRYHPVVFALAASVPALAVPSDDDTKAKLVGALTHVGLEGWSLDLALLGTVDMDVVLDNLLAHRSAMVDGLRVTQQRLDILEARRRQAVAGVVAATRRRR
jgi:polysaccharide pyruvyl transferase WcaK-like protein